MRAVDDKTNFDELMLRAAGTGATGIKIYAKVPANLIPLLEKAAKKHGLKVWSHVFVGPARPQQLVNAGVETISHAPDISAHVVDNFYQLRREGKHITAKQRADSFDLPIYQPLFDDMQKHGTILDATLTIFEKETESGDQRSSLMYEWGQTFTKMAYENGIKISTGTDASSDFYQLPYPLVQYEMQLLVNDIGMTPLEAVQAATINGAEVIGIENNYGDIAKGKVANLVILNQDPSNNIKHVQDIAHVIKNGKFIYIGDDESLPFVSAKKAGGLLWLSGQVGNFPSTKTLASANVEEQMQQAMSNIGSVLQEYDLNYRDIAKCTLMLADIDDWNTASEVYVSFLKHHQHAALMPRQGWRWVQKSKLNVLQSFSEKYDE